MTTQEQITAILQDFYNKIQTNYEFPISHVKDNSDILGQWLQMEDDSQYIIFKESQNSAFEILSCRDRDITVAIENTTDQDYEVELWSYENIIHSFNLWANTINWVIEGYFIPVVCCRYSELTLKFKIAGEYVEPDKSTLFLYSILIKRELRRNFTMEDKVFPMTDKYIYINHGMCSTIHEIEGIIYEPFPHSLANYEYTLK